MLTRLSSLVLSQPLLIVCGFVQWTAPLTVCLSSGSTCVCVFKESDVKWEVVVVDSYVFLC